MGRPKGSKNKEQKPAEEKKVKLTTTRIVCSKCGEKKTTTKLAMDKLIALFGTIEAVHEKYHCMECRKKYNVRKDGQIKPEKNKRKPKIEFKKDESGNVIIPNWMKGALERHSNYLLPSEIFRPTDGPVCHRPDLYLAHSNCNKCTVFEFCNCTSKKIEKTEKKEKKEKK